MTSHTNTGDGIAGRSEYFDRSESVCCGGKLIQWFGKVQPYIGVNQVRAPKWHCMICSQPCETRLNVRFRDTTYDNGAPSPTEGIINT